MSINAKKILAILLVISLGGAVMFGFSGCLNKKYKVDYCGQKSSFEGAQDSYRAGDMVVLKFKYIATDTDYYFYIDGKKFSPDYDSGGGGAYIIRFTMPEHNITVKWTSKNTMTSLEKKTGEMLVDYYTAIVGTDGGDRHYELVLSTAGEEKLMLEVYNGDAGGEESHDTYLIPQDAESRCYDVIDSTKMRQWNDKYADSAIDGAVTSLKFKDDDGTYTRVSTDKMPPDGERKMDEVKAVLEGYIKDECKVN